MTNAPEAATVARTKSCSKLHNGCLARLQGRRCLSAHEDLEEKRSVPAMFSREKSPARSLVGRQRCLESRCRITVAPLGNIGLVERFGRATVEGASHGQGTRSDCEQC